MTCSVRTAGWAALLLLGAPALTGGVEVPRPVPTAMPAHARQRRAGHVMALPGSVGHADGVVAARPHGAPVMQRHHDRDVE